MGTEQLVQLAFEGIEFPYTSITIEGSIRDHVHEYPHTPGGAPEKLGRALYVFDIEVPFHSSLIPAKYKNLWPSNLNTLVTKFEQQETGDLVLPQLGSAVRAYCLNWKRVLTSRNTSGESVTLKFREDSENLRLAQAAFDAKSQGLSSAEEALEEEIRAVPGLNRGLFDTIMFAVDDILAYKDQFDLWTSLIEAKCLSVIAMVRNIVETWEELKDPSRWAVVEALQNLWFEVRSIYEDQKQVGMVSRFWSTPAEHMTLSAVSVGIYGVSSRGSELLTLNNLPDPFDIPRNTQIRYYADAA
jgi:hypothetical protein